MSILSITLPSNTFITNGKHITFKSPCTNQGLTGLLINDDETVYRLVDSHKEALSDSVVFFEAGAMVHVILDVDEHLAYVQSASTSNGSTGESGVTHFNGRQGVVMPMEGDYTAEMVGAAPVVHDHDEAYSKLGHNHTLDELGAASISHTHSASEINGALTQAEADEIYAKKSDSQTFEFSKTDADGWYAAIDHNHDDVYSKLDHNHEDIYSKLEHSHEGLYSPTLHASQHASDGADPITPASIGAAATDHSHTPSDIGAASIDHTHTAADVGAASTEHNHDAVYAPLVHTHDLSELNVASANHTHTVSDITDIDSISGSTGQNYVELSNDVSITIEDNTEYNLTDVTSLRITGSTGSSHGIIYFDYTLSSVQVDEGSFLGSVGDDITAAAAYEVWEFDTYKGFVIWKNWGAI